MRLLVSLAAAFALAAPALAQEGGASADRADEARHRAAVAAQARSQTQAGQVQARRPAVVRPWQRQQAIKRAQLAGEANARNGNPNAARSPAAEPVRGDARQGPAVAAQRVAQVTQRRNRLQQQPSMHPRARAAVKTALARRVASNAAKPTQNVGATARTAWVARHANADAAAPAQGRQQAAVRRSSAGRHVIQRSSSVGRRPVAQPKVGARAQAPARVVKTSKPVAPRRATPARKPAPPTRGKAVRSNAVRSNSKARRR